MNEIKSKLVALEAKVDAKLFAVMRGPDGKWYREDGTEANSVGDFKTVGGAAATAGAVGGGLVADRAIMNRYGGGGSGMAVRKSAYRSAGRDLMESGRAMGGRAIDAGNDGFRAGQRSWRATKPGAFGRVAQSERAYRPIKPGGLLYRLRKAIGTGLGVATGGKLKFSQEIKERLVELASPLGEFNQTYRQQQASAKAAARDARLAFRKAKANYKSYRDSIPDDAIVDAAREKLVRESHIMRGAGVGAVAGAASGTAVALRRLRGGLFGAAVLAPATAVIGAGLGAQIGGRIRKKKSQ